ncbi:hypothetical protein MyChFU_53600 [Mycobacterium intracellulare subsp. chimaera]|uniref:Uncharacterized protein n=1 Tax=Mycobacterium timonense TaxID=701043 RepID=A0A7I9ZDY0_9MYCO|nr:hypothetical protein MTIM_49510 [Mycobacterium timonense]
MKDALDVLEHFGSELAAADARYQAAPAPVAVATLMEDVYSACAAYWAWMACWTTQFRGSGVRVGAEIQNFNLWKRYVGPTWAGLIQILDEVPIEDLGAPERGSVRPRRESRASGYGSRCARSASLCSGPRGRGILRRPS